MINSEAVAQYLNPLTPIPTSMQPTGKIDTKIRCILFDIYGTLFISASGDINAAKVLAIKSKNLQHLLDRYEIVNTPESIFNAFYSAIESAHSRLKQQGIDHPEIRVEKIWKEVLGLDDSKRVKKFAIEYELIVNPIYPFPNLEKTLATIAQKNISMGIISNAQFFTAYLFHWFLGSGPEGLGFQPDLIFYSYKTGWAKPSSFMFQAACKKLQILDIPPHAVLYVGNDMLNDILPAQKAGFKTALFAGDKRSLRLRKDHPKCKNRSPDIIITDLAHLIDQLSIDGGDC